MSSEQSIYERIHEIEINEETKLSMMKLIDGGYEEE